MMSDVMGRRPRARLAIVDMAGRAANRNPSRADPSGVYWGAMSGRFYACQGNTLTGREVIVAMSAAYEETKGSLADRLMAALPAKGYEAECPEGTVYLVEGVEGAQPKSDRASREGSQGPVGCWGAMQPHAAHDVVLFVQAQSDL